MKGEEKGNGRGAIGGSDEDDSDGWKAEYGF